MEIVGLIVVVLVVFAVLGSGGSASKPRAAAPRPQPRRPGAPRGVPVAARPLSRVELERERAADAAFVDGVLFSHYFLDGKEEQGGDDERAGDLGDDYDDGIYD